MSCSHDGTAKVWDVNLRRCLFSMSQHTKPITSVRWGGDGLIYTASRDCTIKVWDATDVRGGGVADSASASALRRTALTPWCIVSPNATVVRGSCAGRSRATATG